jgi:hypothetical protein
MLKLSQEFTFDASAEDIFTLISEAGKMQTCRALTPDYKVTFTHQLRQGVGVTKLRSIIFEGVDICLVKRFDNTQHGVACSINFPHPVAEIALTQEKMGECKASLYVETDLQRIWPQEADQWWRDAHQTFISLFWGFLIKTWIDHRSADKNSTAIPKPVRALFQLSFPHHPSASVFIGGDRETYEVLSWTSTFATTPSLFVQRLNDYLGTIPLPRFQASLGRIQLPLGLIQLAYLAELREAPDWLTDTPVKAETFAFRLSEPRIISEGIISDKTETGKFVVEINAVNC